MLSGEDFPNKKRHVSKDKVCRQKPLIAPVGPHAGSCVSETKLPQTDILVGDRLTL